MLLVGTDQAQSRDLLGVLNERTSASAVVFDVRVVVMVDRLLVSTSAPRFAAVWALFVVGSERRRP
jgi:hypothetical protein